MMNPVLLVALLVMLAVYAAMVGIYRWLGWTRDVEARIAETTAAPQAAGGRERLGLSDRVNQRLRNMSFAERIDHQLVMADSSMTAGEYFLTRAGLAIACLMLGWFVSGQPLGGSLLAIGGWMAPAFYIRRKQSKRLRDFADQLPDMLSMLVGSLRAGYGLLHAVTAVKEEMPDPIATEFGRVVRETALGYSIGDAMDHMVERIENDDLALIVTAIHIQNEVGGSLADVLDSITTTIRDRIKLNGEVRALTAQQRTAGTILSVLPFLVGTLLMLINPDYMMAVFKPGWPMLFPAFTVVMVILGNLAMRMFVKIEV